MTDLDKVNRVVTQFCADVVREPLSYFSEADLQSQLFARLIAAFPEMVPTSVKRGPDDRGKSTYRTSRVHREYGAGGGRRIDLCVFAESDVGALNESSLQADGRYLTPEFLIELGTEKTVDTRAHIQNDLNKLEKAKVRGYLIHFERDVTVADPGTRRRDLTEKRIDDHLKADFRLLKVPANVVHLCLLLRIRRSTTRIWGKCEFHASGSRDWQKVSLSRVQDRVLAALKQAEAGR